LNLSILSLGHVHTESFEPLTQHLTRIEQVVTNLPSQARLLDARAELNRAIDAAANDWVLVLRERETLDDAVAGEIAGALRSPQCWGYRVRTVPMYAGKPLHIDQEGELRLFQRRHLLRRGELIVEGSVVRLENTLQAITFSSTDEHRAYLAKRAVPHSRLRQLLIFLRNARTLDSNTLRYVWIEAGFDHAI